MNPLAWPAETWLSVCEWGGLIAAAASVLLLYGALKAGKIVNDRQALEMQNLKLDVATQQERAAKAELATEELKRRMAPRGLPQNFLEVMKTKPRGKAEILYQEGVPEVKGFADSLHLWLTMAGWQIPEPKPVASVFEPGKDFVLGEVMFRSYDPEHLPDHIQALRNELFPTGLNMQILHDKSMAKDAPVQILIAPKLYW